MEFRSKRRRTDHACDSNRGVTYWSDGHDQRILFVSRHWLYALNARTGLLVTEFGAGGRVDLREGLGRDRREISISATTP
jgi:quinoprotein glucose dehydrogenase